MKIHFAIFNQATLVKESYETLVKLYGQVNLASADVVVVLGGDGSVLRAIHAVCFEKPIFSMNRGNFGFLTNTYSLENLISRIEDAVTVLIKPLIMEAVDLSGERHNAFAVNEIYVTRSSHQAAKIKIIVNNVVRLAQLVSDGVITSTSMGSTAYNYSAHGPIFPISSNLIAITPISAFRPRMWRGALLDASSKIILDIKDPDKRPVLVTADFIEFKNIKYLEIYEDSINKVSLLFDKNNQLSEKILNEQFAG